MSFAGNLSAKERRQARINAYASTWFGCIAEVMMDSSAIIILFITMLDGSETMTMLSTSISAIASMFLVIPCAGLADKVGLKRSVTLSCLMGCIGYFLMAAAPFFGNVSAKYIVILGCLIYAVSRPVYASTWYVFLDNFLLSSERGAFFGFMRFSYMIISGLLFFIAGLAMGKNPPVWLMQIFLCVAGLCLMGRKYYMDRLPVDPAPQPVYDIGKALSISIKNSSLIGFAVYVCCLGATFCSITPLTFIYLKKELCAGDNIIQIISSISISGMIIGYFLYGKLLKLMGMKHMQLMIHALYVAIPLLLFFCGKEVPGHIAIITVLLFISGFVSACFSCSYSTELLALARPGNKIMATAFGQMYSSFGTAFGRMFTSIVLGSGILAPVWTKWDITFSKFQSFFMIYAVLAFFTLILLIGLPSINQEREDYYEP